MRMDESVKQTDMSIRNGYACFDWMDVSIRRQPCSTEWMCLLDEWICLFGTVAPVPTEQTCLFGMVMLIPIEHMCLLRKASSEFLHKWQNFTPKWITQKFRITTTTRINEFKKILLNFFQNSGFWSVFFFYFRSLNKWKIRVNLD